MDFRDRGSRGLVVWTGWGVDGIFRCLNQDLRDSDGFSGWGVARDEVVERVEGLTG